jgi:glycosyltransferase involved in cell wall biosynthesis
LLVALSAGLDGRVRFLGHRTDVSSVLAAADICCQPNEGAEPFGLSFVEALAAGLPVVTTRLGAAPEIVDDTCGILVEPGSAAALGDALHRLITCAEDRRSMAAAAMDRARLFCDLPGSLTQLRALLTRATEPVHSPTSS